MKLLAPFFSALLLAGVTLQAQEAPPQQPQGEQAAQEQAATQLLSEWLKRCTLSILTQKAS